MKVDCPTCSAAVEWSEESPFRPFCSKKCQLIDLGDWASEEHKIASKPEEAASPDAIDVEEIEAMLAKQGDQFFSH